MLTIGLALFASALLFYAALHDLAVRTVPNWLSATVFGIGCCARLDDHSLIAGVTAAAVTFAVLFVLWVLGAMGGGDVKLWAASAALVPPYWQPELEFFLRVVVFGGILAILYLVMAPFIRKPAASRQGGMLRRVLRTEAWRIGRRAPLPYACAIATGAITTLMPLTLQR
jgi:prepilin peptidase CpaA